MSRLPLLQALTAYDQYGKVAELLRHPSPAPHLDAVGGQRLLACLIAQPDVTLAEIGAAQRAAGGPQLSCPAVWRATERPGGDAKKAYMPLSA